MRKVFVYGSLKRGFRLNPVLMSQKFIGEDKTKAGFTLFDLGPFPGMKQLGDGVVHGEVYEVNEECLDRLDGIEGHPHHYKRTPITLQSGMDVETYIWQPSHARCEVVESGVWK